MATTEVEGQVHDVDRRQSRLEGMLEMMVENQREYRQDMRNLTSCIDRLFYWQFALLLAILGGFISIYFKS